MLEQWDGVPNPFSCDPGGFGQPILRSLLPGQTWPKHKRNDKQTNNKACADQIPREQDWLENSLNQKPVCASQPAGECMHLSSVKCSRIFAVNVIAIIR